MYVSVWHIRNARVLRVQYISASNIKGVDTKTNVYLFLKKSFKKASFTCMQKNAKFIYRCRDWELNLGFIVAKWGDYSYTTWPQSIFVTLKLSTNNNTASRLSPKYRNLENVISTTLDKVCSLPIYHFWISHNAPWLIGGQ